MNSSYDRHSSINQETLAENYYTALRDSYYTVRPVTTVDWPAAGPLGAGGRAYPSRPWDT